MTAPDIRILNTGMADRKLSVWDYTVANAFLFDCRIIYRIFGYVLITKNA